MNAIFQVHSALPLYPPTHPKIFPLPGLRMPPRQNRIKFKHDPVYTAELRLQVWDSRKSWPHSLQGGCNGLGMPRFGRILPRCDISNRAPSSTSHATLRLISPPSIHLFLPMISFTNLGANSTMSETDIGVNVASPQPQDAHGIRQRLRPNYARVRTGCLTCRRRKKKCDEKKPVCSGCSRNKLACRWPENRGDESPTTSLARSSNDMNASPVPKVKIANHLHRLDNPCTLKPESYLLLRHYLCETGAMLAAQPLHKNPFITHVAPLAYMDDLLMHAVLALSGTHLAFGNGSDDGTQTAALCHYSTVISGLRQRADLFQVQDIQKSVRMLLILLVMCHYEVVQSLT